MGLIRTLVAEWGFARVFIVSTIPLVVLAVIVVVALNATGEGRDGNGGGGDDPKPSTSQTGDEGIEVPHLTGSTLASVYNAHGSDFDFDVVKAPDDAPEDEVIGQYPYSGSSAEPGDIIEVTISEGSEEASTTEVSTPEVSTPEFTTETTEFTPDEEYPNISSDDGSLTVSVPAEWNDINPGGRWMEDKLPGEDLGPFLLASPDTASYDPYGGSDTPGVFFAASSRLVELYPEDPVGSVLDEALPAIPDGCTLAPLDNDDDGTYDDGAYVGMEEKWICDNYAVHDIVAMPSDGSFVVYVQIVVDSDTSEETVSEIENSFFVEGSV
ncbi:hypothetical protein BH20ACT10_BH20ACT10_06540 [soil metagenome]